MAAGNATAQLKLLIEATLKDKGLIDAKAKVGDLEKQVAKLEGRLAATKGVGQQFGQVIGQYIGGAAIGAFILQSVQRFASLERALNATAFRMRALGLDAERELPRVTEGLKAIQAGGGPLVSETVPIFERFVGITKDSGAALYAVKLAADASESGLVETGAAADAMAAIMQGKGAAAAKALGIELKDANGHTKTNAQLLDESIRLFEGLGDAIDDTANTLDIMGGTWEDLKQTVGQAASYLVGPIEWLLSHGIAVVKDLGAVLGLVANMGITTFSRLGETLRTIFDLKKLFTSPAAYWEDVKGVVAKNLSEIKINLDAFTEGVAANHRREVHSLEISEQDKLNLRRVALKNSLEDENAAADARAEAEAKLLWKLHQMNVAAFEATMRKRQELLNAQLQRELEAGLEAVRARIAGELALQDAQRDDRIATLDEGLRDLSQLEGTALLGQVDLYRFSLQERARLAKEAAMAEAVDEIARTRATGDAAAAIKQRAATRIRGIETQLTKDEIALNESVKQSKVQAAVMGLQVLTTLFPKVKAFAIAQAIISTIQASIEAFKNGGGWPWGLVPMALTLAQGYAQVQAIRKQQPALAAGGIAMGEVSATIGEKGRELVAPLEGSLGRRFVGQFGSAVASAVIDQTRRSAAESGAPAAIGGSVTHVYQTTQTFHGLLIDRRGLRQAARLVEQGSRLNDARKAR